MMRVIFMGTPDFAVPSLDAIVAAGHIVVGVVTVPDRRQGRGRKVQPSPVRRRADELGLPVYTPEELDDPEFLLEMGQLAPDVMCIVAFRILPEELYSIPVHGSFNLHGSLLPAYRGAAPINRAIMNGEEKTGVTTFFLKRKVDTGDMILQREIPIAPDMTAGELHDRMMIVGAEVVVETLNLIESGAATSYSQNDQLASTAPKIFQEDCRIDWTRDGRDIYNQIRGLSPYPGAFTYLNGKRLKVIRARYLDGADLKPGEIEVDQGSLNVGTSGNSIGLLEVQLEGRSAMGIEEFLRGNEIPSGSILS